MLPAVYVSVPGKAADVPRVNVLDPISRSPEVIVNTPFAPAGASERLNGIVTTPPVPAAIVKLAGPAVDGNTFAVIVAPVVS